MSENIAEDKKDKLIAQQEHQIRNLKQKLLNAKGDGTGQWFIGQCVGESVPVEVSCLDGGVFRGKVVAHTALNLVVQTDDEQVLIYKQGIISIKRAKAVTA